MNPPRLGRRRATLGIAALSASLAALVSAVLVADAARPKVALFEATSLVREDGRLGRIEAPTRFAKTSSHGSTLAADATGLWIVERNAGALLRTDHAGELKATIPLHEGLGELVLEPGTGTLFVADRQADRVLRFETKADPDNATPAGEIAVVEPHGLALAPDGQTLFVTSVANHELVAIDVASASVRWQVELVAEPRAVAVSPEGRFVLVGFLTTGALARIDLDAIPEAGPRKQDVSWDALSPRDMVQIDVSFEEEWGEIVEAQTVEAGSRFDVPVDAGRRQACNVFALAYVGEGIAVAGVQISTPQMELRPTSDRDDAYGGGAAEIAPIEYRFARVAEPSPDGLALVDQHHLTLHQPRALAYDRGRDVLYIGGYGDDEIVAIRQASSERPMMAWHGSLGMGSACGLDGLALVDQDGPGMALWAHCELSRSVVRIDFDPEKLDAVPIPARKWVRGPELAPSLRSATVERGAELFRRGEDFSLGGALACASCHPEGRNDGLSWRLGRSIMQTPMLAGRVVETSPYKWTGEDPSLQQSFRHTIERIGGDPDALASRDLDALADYLSSLPEPRPPTRLDEAARTRGAAVFERECALCHAGERSTDRERHEFNTTLAEVDTPSLIGVAHSAPYYHDGSAIDLGALLDDRGSIHDMVDTSELSAEQRRDLITYLRSL